MTVVPGPADGASWPDVDQVADELEEFRRANGYLAIWEHGPDRIIAVTQTIFGAQILAGGSTQEAGVTDRWSYAGLRPVATAVAAAEVWRAAGFDGEPDGWIRHQPSNRRRTYLVELVDGDPVYTEVIEP